MFIWNIYIYLLFLSVWDLLPALWFCLPDLLRVLTNRKWQTHCGYYCGTALTFFWSVYISYPVYMLKPLHFVNQIVIEFRHKLLTDLEKKSFVILEFQAVASLESSRFSSINVEHVTCLWTLVSCSKLFSRKEIFCFWATFPRPSSQSSSALLKQSKSSEKNHHLMRWF